MKSDAVLDAGRAVLVLDLDEIAKTQCLVEIRRLGFAPLSAQDAWEAEALLERGQAAIAIIDSGFPGTGDLSFIGSLAGRTFGARQRPKVILTAVRPSKELALTALRASVVDLLEKPVAPASLAQALQRAMGGGRQAAGKETAPEKKSLSARLAALSREWSHVAGLIRVQAPGVDAGAVPPPVIEAPSEQVRDTEKPGAVATDIPEYIRGLLRDAIVRRTIGGGELFGDPAWEMLLDLLLAEFEGRKVSVTSACIASGAPMTTALRLVRRLVEQGILVRYPDESDRRREFLSLSPSVAETLSDYVRRESGTTQRR